MTAIPPLTFRYLDGKMVPRSKAQADRHYVEGETYALEEYNARSINSHNHFFASLTDAWTNLPEALADTYPSIEHFRKRLLIQAGFCDEQKTVFSTEKDAIKAAAIAWQRDDYCVADVQGNVLTIWTAKSQSMRAMGRADFQKSKSAVLELAASLIGTTTDALAESAEKAA